MDDYLLMVLLMFFYIFIGMFFFYKVRESKKLMSVYLFLVTPLLCIFLQVNKANIIYFVMYALLTSCIFMLESLIKDN